MSKSDTLEVSTVNNEVQGEILRKKPDKFKRPIPRGGPIKEALSPSVAESIRSVFAAFVWHEGVVHDAMAVASYLKFHPNLSKENSISLANIDSEKREEVKKEYSRQQRHSVEVRF